MDTGKRQHLQDIYATDRTDRDDFTPQVSQAILEERKRDIRRHQFTSFILGASVLILLVALVYIIAREYIVSNPNTVAPPPLTEEYTPLHSLKVEDEWVLSSPRKYGAPEWSGEGDRPFSAEWVRKAAYNLVRAEKAIEVGEYGEAAKYYENALEILPDLEGVKVPLGMIYFQLQEFEKALILLENAPETDMTPAVLNNLGIACLSAESYDRAETYLKQAIAVEPTYPEPRKNLALVYKEQKRDEEAIASFEKYIDLRPRDIDTQRNFALYLTKLGKWERVATLLSQLTEEITDVPELYFLLARAETHQGNSQAAMAALRRGFKLTDSNNALGWMDDKEFDQLREDDEFQSMIRMLESQKD